MPVVPSYVLISAIILLASLLALSVYFNIKMGLIVLRVEDSIEDCLDIIDERYQSISRILEIPIFFDSVEVRQVVEDIRVTRDSLLVIANSLTEVEEGTNEKKSS